MGKNEKKGYLAAIVIKYFNAGRKEKERILSDFCSICEYNRKYAIRLLNNYKLVKEVKRAGPKPIYRDEELLTIIKTIWFTADQPCGKRLKALLPEWLPHFEHNNKQLNETHRTLLLSISAATLDRILKPIRTSIKPKGMSGTKSGGYLKNYIPIKTEHWGVTSPGYLGADTVAHCGNSLAGKFVWSLTMTDINTGWTENRAVWNKCSQEVQTQVSDIEYCLPFKLKGVHTDNGTEFINYGLLDYLQNRENPIDFTRSRPYKKNDNAHVEQKNYTHVRQLLGYDRLEDVRIMKLLNDLYRNEWSLYQNHFVPSMKLLSKTRVGAKIKKKYEAPETPYSRIMKSEDIDEVTKKRLRIKHESLNPFKLKADIEQKLEQIFNYVKVTSNVRQRC